MIARAWAAMRNAAPLTFWAMLGGGLAATALFAALALIVWLGGWDTSRQAQQLSYLGQALLAMAGLIALVMVRLTGTSLKGRIGESEFDLAPHEKDPKT